MVQLQYIYVNEITLHVTFKMFYESAKNADKSNLPLRLGVSPKKTHSETDMSRDAKTVIIALSARPHLDFTISILPAHHHPHHHHHQ